MKTTGETTILVGTTIVDKTEDPNCDTFQLGIGIAGVMIDRNDWHLVLSHCVECTFPFLSSLNMRGV